MYRSYIDNVEARLRRDAGQIVLIDDHGEHGGGDLLRLIVRFAQVLAARGIGPGHRVGLLAPLTVEAVAMRLAVARLGAAAVFCPDAGSPDRLAVFLSRAAVTTLIVWPDTVDRAPECEVQQLLAVGEVHGVTDVTVRLDAHDATPPVSRSAGPDDECALVATGGTTGVSKASVRSFAEYERLVDLGPTPGRRQLVCTPLAYIAQTMVDTVLLGGGTVVLHSGERNRPPTPESVLDVVERQRITHVALVEPQLVELVHSDRLASTDLSSVVAISHVGSDAAASLRRRLVSRFDRPILVNPYGASEFGVVSMLAGYDYTAQSARLDTSGRPLPTVDVRIAGADGRACKPGEEGQIMVRTPAQAHRYSIAPPHSGFADDGWFHTGDTGLLDIAGYLLVRGRTADRRELDGANVFPVDVQNVLCRHPDIRYAVAVPGPRNCEVPFGVAACPVSGASVTTDEVTVLLAELHPALSECPVAILQQIPTTEQGKPDRPTLTSMLFART